MLLFKSLICLVVMIFAITTYGYCYLDPSTTTYVLQIVIAVFVGLGTTIGIFFYKIKRFILKKKFKEEDEEDEED